MRDGARSFGTILVLLVAGGILASAARGDQCDVTIRWNGGVYTASEARFAVLEPAQPLGEAQVPDCTVGGRCAPPDETVAAFAIEGVPSHAAVLAPGYEGLFVAAGTFPELRDHPLHEAVYGLPTRPSFRADCGAPFAFGGTVTQVDPLRVDVEISDVENLDEDGEGAWLQIDSGTHIDGFDRDGIATLEPGDEIEVVARTCEGELPGPLADRIEPRG